MSIWDEFKRADEKWTADNPGDSIAGTLIGMSVATMPRDNSRVPALTIRKDDGTEVGVLAGATQLQRKLAALDPQVGCRIAITFTHEEQLVGKPSPMKHFDVAIKPATDTANAATPAAAPAVSAADLI